MSVPEFGDLGKTARDLLTKDFNFGKTKLEAKTTFAKGSDFTSTLERNDGDGTIRGEIKTKFTHHSGLIFTETYSTSNNLTLKAEVPDVVDGLKVDLEGSFSPSSSDKDAKLGFVYKASNATLTGNAGTSPKQNLKVDAVYSDQGYFLGAQVAYSPSSGALASYSAIAGFSSAPGKYELAAQGSTNAVKNTSLFGFSFSHTISSSVSLAASAVWGTGDKKVLVEVGTLRKIDDSTSMKFKLDSSGKAGLGFTHKLRPDVKATLGVFIDTQNLDQNAHKLGYTFVFEPK